MVLLGGGSDEPNFWTDAVVRPELAELGLQLATSRVPDTRDAVDQVIADAASGRGLGEGTVDLIWINGENFVSLDRQDLLFGPFADKLPNSRYFFLEESDPRAHQPVRQRHPDPVARDPLGAVSVHLYGRHGAAGAGRRPTHL